MELSLKAKTRLAILASAVANATYIAGNGCIIATQTKRNVQNAGIIGAVVGAIFGGAVGWLDLMPDKTVIQEAGKTIIQSQPKEVTKLAMQRLLAAPLLGTSAMLAVYYLLKMLIAKNERPESAKDPNSPIYHAAGSVIIGAVLFSAGRMK